MGAPITLCFSAVSINPTNAIYIYTRYAFDKKNKNPKDAQFIDWKKFSFSRTISSEEWKKDGPVNYDSIISWADALYYDMFGKKYSKLAPVERAGQKKA
jgi:hypothetical protein